MEVTVVMAVVMAMVVTVVAVRAMPAASGVSRQGRRGDCQDGEDQYERANHMAPPRYYASESTPPRTVTLAESLALAGANPVTAIVGAAGDNVGIDERPIGELR